jgi:hypothetical protein
VVTLVVRVSPQNRERVMELAKELGTRLGGKGRASVTPDHGVALQLSALSLTVLALRWRADEAVRPHLIPLGVLRNDQSMYGNWDELGHILLVGLPGGGTDVILTNLVASVAAQYRPDELRVVTIADSHTLLSQLPRLPHHADNIINPEDVDSASG